MVKNYFKKINNQRLTSQAPFYLIPALIAEASEKEPPFSTGLTWLKNRIAASDFLTEPLKGYSESVSSILDCYFKSADTTCD